MLHGVMNTKYEENVRQVESDSKSGENYYQMDIRSVQSSIILKNVRQSITSHQLLKN